MAGYCGTELQQRLQRRAEEVLDRASDTPGYCNGGRVVTLDDPERVGWDTVFAELERDGVLGFRMVPSDSISELILRLTDAGYRVDVHDTFTAEAVPALRLSREIISSGPPSGLRHVELPARGDEPLVASVQEFMLASGITPFAGSMLVGERNRSKTFVLMDAAGSVAATAHTYLPHNPSSAFHDHAWAGLVAVSPALRGKSLGRYINACAVVAAFADLGASVVYELVHESNPASRRMVESCGLRAQPAYKTAAATAGQERFTR